MMGKRSTLHPKDQQDECFCFSSSPRQGESDVQNFRSLTYQENACLVRASLGCCGVEEVQLRWENSI